MKDELFEAQLLRAIGYAPYGGADAAECLAVAGRITGTSLDSWHDAWMAAAARLYGQAEANAAAGQVASARSGFFRAANYFRTAGLFAMGVPLDPRLAEAHRREADSFRRGAALLAVPPEIVQIPYEDTFLPGYHFRAADDAAPRATMILVTGYDGTAEELYFANGAAALERGYNVLAFDGPGQGAMLIDRGVPLRPDWENVITPVVDYLLTRPDTDPARIVLNGLSLGGYLAPQHGWRFPFYVAAAPGFVIALVVLFLKEPERGQFDSLKETPERGTILGLARNRAFLTSTLGMAAMTFSLGGIQVWMPKFLFSERGYTLEAANFAFGIIIVVDGILAALVGGWLGDYLLPRIKSSYYLVSAASMLLGVPVMIVALFVRGPLMIPAIGVAAFFLLLNTAPLNAAVINSVGAHIRVTALAVNIFIIHLLGDVPSPTMMGWVADRRSLQAAFILPVIAMGISSAILFYGMKFAPAVAVNGKKTFTTEDTK